MCGQIHAVIATVETGFLTGIPTTMVEDIAPSLKALDNAVMEHSKVRFIQQLFCCPSILKKAVWDLAPLQVLQFSLEAVAEYAVPVLTVGHNRRMLRTVACMQVHLCLEANKNDTR